MYHIFAESYMNTMIWDNNSIDGKKLIVILQQLFH